MGTCTMIATLPEWADDLPTVTLIAQLFVPGIGDRGMGNTYAPHPQNSILAT